MADQGTADTESWIGSHYPMRFLPTALRIIVAGLLVLAGTGGHAAIAQALAPSRIAGPIRPNRMLPVRGTIPPMTARAHDEGQLSGATAIRNMSLVFRRSAAQQADLDKLLQAQQTKGSPNYRQWLTPARFADRYGVSQSDLEKSAAWLRSQGFKIGVIPASRDRINFSGTAAQVNAAFRTQLHRYSLHGEMRWANATDLSFPQAIAEMALGIENLNTFRPRPHVIRRQIEARQNSAGQPRASSRLGSHYTLHGSNGPVNFLAPADIATIYNINGLYNNGITGKGQTLAVVGQTDIVQYLGDVETFRKLSGLDASNLPTQVLVPNTGSAQARSGDLEEAHIDVEWSGAVAKDASILYVTVGNNPNNNVLNALQYAIQTPLLSNSRVVPVISISYGLCEQGLAGSGYVQVLENILQQANAQGQTVVASSGDSGSADCDRTGQDSNGSYVGANTGQGLAVDYPASSRYVTSVGGTSFSADRANQAQYWDNENNEKNGSALSYIPETTWNNTPNLTGLQNLGSLSAGGGGASILFAKPSWQVGPTVPNDGMRDVPDISLASDPGHDGYVLCTDETNNAGALTGTSSCVYPVGSNEVPYFDANRTGYLYGGTSIAAPQIAGLITLWNQQAESSTGVGNVNPILYQVAQDAPGSFHDVTTGSNAVVCRQGSKDCITDGTGSHAMSCCNAGSGYDMATGLGSVDAAAMGAAWPSLSVTTQNPLQPTFSIVPTPRALSIVSGGSATVSLVVTPGAGFAGTIQLACSSLPANIACNFSTASINVAANTSNTAQTVALTVSNSASAQLSTTPPLHRGWPVETVFAGVFGLSIFGIGTKRKLFLQKSSRWKAFSFLALGFLIASALTACGSKSSGSSQNPPGGNNGPPITSTITVTGTSANTTVTNKIQLTITS